MKKTTHTAKQQARRERALSRFSISPKYAAQTPAEYALYVARKEQELASLRG